MTHRCILYGAAPMLALALSGCATATTPADAGKGEPPLLATDFEHTDPFDGGWAWGKPSWARKAGTPGTAAWTDAGGKRGRTLTVRSGMWRSPPVTPPPLSYLELSFVSRTETKGYYGVLFYDEAGREIPASVYSGIHATPDWHPTRSIVLVPADTASAKVLFWPTASPIEVDAVALRIVDAQTALERIDALYATLPPVPADRPAGRWDRLPRIRARLAAGETLTVVCIGDSVANDLAHSQFHLLVQRAWPGSTIVFHNAVGSGARPKDYLAGDLLQRQVLDRKPDLVLFGGMSTLARDVPQLVQVARRIQDHGAAFGVFSGTLLLPRYWDNFEHARKQRLQYRAALATAGAEAGFAVMDLGGAWEAYVQACGKPVAYFRRDHHHANDRGKQIYGRLLARWFLP